jgi:hypothetical protein
VAAVLEKQPTTENQLLAEMRYVPGVFDDDQSNWRWAGVPFERRWRWI